MYNKETNEEVNDNESLAERVEALLKAEGMPLFPPGRRQWTEKSFKLSIVL